MGAYLKASVVDYTKNKQTPYSVISSNGSWKLVDFGEEESFEDLIYQAYDEFMLQCNFACQELTIGVYGGINSFAQARDLCLKISDKLCDDWEEIITSLEHYMNVLKSGKKINMAYAEQKDLLDSFYELTKSIPTYENDLYH